MAQVIGNETETVEDSILDATVEATVEVVEKATTKRDPLAKYNELSAEDQQTVDEIVEDVLARVGGEDINLALLLGVLDKLNAEKKTAKEAEKVKEKERKEIAKQEAEERGKTIKESIKEGDTIDYFMSTAKVTILQASVIKVTEKSARIEVTEDSLVLFKGKEIKAGDVPGLKLGKKSVPFGKISNWKRNGEDVAIAA